MINFNSSLCGARNRSPLQNTANQQDKQDTALDETTTVSPAATRNLSTTQLMNPNMFNGLFQLLQTMMAMMQLLMGQKGNSLSSSLPSTSFPAPLPAGTPTLIQQNGETLVNLSNNNSIEARQLALVKGTPSPELEQLASQSSKLDPESAEFKSNQTALTQAWQDAGGDITDNSLQQYVLLQNIKEANTSRQQGIAPFVTPNRNQYPATNEGTQQYQAALAAFQNTLQSRKDYQALIAEGDTTNAGLPADTPTLIQQNGQTLVNLSSNTSISERQKTLLKATPSAKLEELASLAPQLEPESQEAKDNQDALTQAWKDEGGDTTDNSLEQYVVLQSIKAANTNRQQGIAPFVMPDRSKYPNTSAGAEQYQSALAAFQGTLQSREAYKSLIG